MPASNHTLAAALTAFTFLVSMQVTKADSAADWQLQRPLDPSDEQLRVGHKGRAVIDVSDNNTTLEKSALERIAAFVSRRAHVGYGSDAAGGPRAQPFPASERTNGQQSARTRG